MNKHQILAPVKIGHKRKTSTFLPEGKSRTELARLYERIQRLRSDKMADEMNLISKDPGFAEYLQKRVSGGEVFFADHRMFAEEYLHIKMHSIGNRAKDFVKRVSVKDFRRIQRVCERLQGSGLLFEDIIESYPTRRGKISGPVFFRTKRLGTPLSIVLFGKSKVHLDKTRFLENLAVALGKMHSFGVAHNHPHSGNIVLYRGKVGFIDMTDARYQRIDWSNVKRVAKFFVSDYKGVLPIIKTIAKPSELNSSIKKFLELLVDQYPMTKEKKAELLKFML